MKASGIYRIHNTVTGDKYVGSAVDIPKRWKRHRRQLRKGVHHSAYLQNAWNKYGESAFVFTVVGYCGKPELLKFEQRAIDVSGPAFNMAPVAGSMLGYKFTKGQRAQLSESHRGKPSGMKGKHHTAEANEKNRRAHLGSKTGPRSAAQRARIARAIRATRTKRAPAPRKYAPMCAAGRVNIGRARATLTDEQVRAIRSMYARGEKTQREIGARFGIAPSAVGKIVRRDQYKWVA